MTKPYVRRTALVALVSALAVTPLAAQTPASQSAQAVAPSKPQTTPPVPPAPQRYERQEPAPRPAGRPDSQLLSDVERQLRLERDAQTYLYTRPIFRIGQDYSVKPGETVREVVSTLANVRIDGHVERDVVVILGDATIASTAVIDGSLVVVGGSSTIQQGAVVRHDYVVVGGTSDTPADFSPSGEVVLVGAPFIGNSLRALMPWLTRGLLWGRLIVPDLPWVWGIVFISFFIGLVMNQLFNRQVAATAEVIGRRPISAFFMGLLVLLLSGPILAIIAASIIGLAVIPFAIAALIVAGMIGKVGVARAIGQGIVSVDDRLSPSQGARSFVVGFVVIMVAYMIPVLGILTWALVSVFGLGAATMSFATSLRRERPAPPVKPVEPTPVQPPPMSPPPAFTPPPVSSSAAMAAEAMISEGAPPPIAPNAPIGHGANDLTLYPRASFFDRIAAFALDLVLVAILSSILRIRPYGGPMRDDDGWFFLVMVVYTIGFIAWKGTTLGGIIINLRVVRTNGAEPRFVDSLVRGLSAIFSVVALGIGVFWMINDAERQMWHDKIAGTVVVKVPRELVLA